jgi:hypothetical protein
LLVNWLAAACYLPVCGQLRHFLLIRWQVAVLVLSARYSGCKCHLLAIVIHRRINCFSTVNMPVVKIFWRNGKVSI